MKAQDSILVRLAARADVPAVAEIQVSAWQTAYAGILPDSVLDAQNIEKRIKIWSRLLDTKVGSLWVAEDRGGVIGFCHTQRGREESDWGEITAVYISPIAWSRGAGTHLVEKALAELKKEDYPRAFLWVLAENPRARNFYERCGMSLDGHNKWVLFGDVEVEELRYAIEL